MYFLYLVYNLDAKRTSVGSGTAPNKSGQTDTLTKRSLLQLHLWFLYIEQFVTCEGWVLRNGGDSCNTLVTPSRALLLVLISMLPQFFP